MILLLIVLNLFIPPINRAEQPLMVCPISEPFKTKENICANFIEICVKKGDPECDAFQGACKQCPALNYTILTYSEVLKLKDKIKQEISVFKKNAENMTNAIKKRDEENLENMTNAIKKRDEENLVTIQKVLENLYKKDNWTMNLFIAEIIIIISMFLCLIIEIRFKLLTKLSERFCNRGNQKIYELLESRKSVKVKDFNSATETNFQNLDSRLQEITKSINTIQDFNSATETNFQNLDSRLQEITKSINTFQDFNSATETNFQNLDFVTTSILDQRLSPLNSHLNMILRQLQNSNNNVKSVITCRIIGFDKTIKVDLFHTDSVVKIKKRICNKWSDAKTHFYKIMNLKLKNTVLDNNQYLLSLLSSEDEAVDCEIEEKIDSEQIVILQMRGNANVPDLIQISKNETIDALKQIIYKFIDSRDIAILRGCEELKNECTIEYYKFKDDDVLTAIKRESGKLVIRSVLEENESIVVEYSNIDSIYSINNKIANKFNYDSENVFLFLNKECLDENKFIYEYNINNESVIKYYYLMKFKEMKPGESIDKGYNSEIVKGRNETTKKDLLLLKFDLRVADLKLDRENIKTSIQDQMQNYHRLFLQLHGVYSDGLYLYLALENMEGGTLTNYLKKHPNVTDDQMRIWSKQILEYLQCIHRNGNIYIDLKPYDIFVDKDNNLKIHGVTLNKYFYKTNRKEKIRKMIENKNLPSTYLAPEVRAERFYDESADVWSFGVTLIYIATGKCPDIGTSDVLEYNLKSKNSELKRFIDSCIKVDPKERSKIDTLFQHEFLNKQ